MHIAFGSPAENLPQKLEIAATDFPEERSSMDRAGF